MRKIPYYCVVFRNIIRQINYEKNTILLRCIQKHNTIQSIMRKIPYYCVVFRNIIRSIMRSIMRKIPYYCAVFRNIIRQINYEKNTILLRCIQKHNRSIMRKIPYYCDVFRNIRSIMRKIPYYCVVFRNIIRQINYEKNTILLRCIQKHNTIDQL